jgi:hypothetical protein
MMLWLAFDFARLTGFNVPPRDTKFFAGMLGIAMLLFLASWRLFTRQFGPRSAITFGADAIIFERWGMWGGAKRFAVPRSEIVAFGLLEVRGGPQFSVEITPAHAITLGLRQATTRQDSAFVATPTLRFAGYGFHDPMNVVLDALRADLARAGLAFGEVNAGRTLPLGKRWPVVNALGCAV